MVGNSTDLDQIRSLRGLFHGERIHFIWYSLLAVRRSRKKTRKSADHGLIAIESSIRTKQYKSIVAEILCSAISEGNRITIYKIPHLDDILLT